MKTQIIFLQSLPFKNQAMVGNHRREQTSLQLPSNFSGFSASVVMRPSLPNHFLTSKPVDSTKRLASPTKGPTLPHHIPHLIHSISKILSELSSNITAPKLTPSGSNQVLCCEIDNHFFPSLSFSLSLC